jgi:hypothetical protein
MMDAWHEDEKHEAMTVGRQGLANSRVEGVR